MIQSAYYTSPYVREQHIIDELVSRVRAHDLPQALPSEAVALDLESSVDADDVYASETSIRLYKPRATHDTSMSAVQSATTLVLQDISYYCKRAQIHATHIWNTLLARYEAYVAAREAATEPMYVDTASMQDAAEVLEDTTTVWRLHITEQSDIREIPIRIAPAAQPLVQQNRESDASIVLLTLRIVLARICSLYNIVDTQAR